MKNQLPVAGLSVLLALAGLTAAVAGEPAKAPVPPVRPVIVLMTAGISDSNLVYRVTEFVRWNYHCGVSVRAHPAELGKTTREEIGKLAGLVQSNDLCLVALVDAPAELEKYVALDKRVALLNVRTLRPDPPDAELFARRVETETMASIGRLLGLKPCPFLRCALYEWSSLKELDAMSRNLCPPCQDKAVAILEKRGALIPFPAQ